MTTVESGPALTSGIHGLIRAAARADPGRTAVVTDHGQLTFGDLDQLSDALCGRMVDGGLRPRGVVGLRLDRGLAQVVALLAVLKAGCGYLPLDRRYPADRLRHMVDSAGVALVLTGPDDPVGRGGPPGPDDLAGAARLPVRLRSLAADGPRPAAARPVHAEDLAYVLFTSGTTGRPKAVEITHGNLAALFDGLSATVWRDLGHCRVAWNASASFDASVQQWLRLCRGDTLVLLDDETRIDPAALVDHLVRHDVTDLDVVPTHLTQLLGPLAATGRPMRILVGGEPVPRHLWQALARLAGTQGLRAWNMYGPTECTVDASAAEVTGSTPHIGRPLPAVRCHVLGPGLTPVPAGRIGELFIAGPGVGRGYRGLPGPTAASFLPDPVAGDGGRMYRTRDLVRQHPDGRLEFVRRRDRQVKVNGYRVELGEVEAALTALPQVVGAAALLRSDLPAGTGIAAYVVLADQATTQQVRDGLRRHLPAYLHPAAVLELAVLPTGASGKVDYAALARCPAGGHGGQPSRPATAEDPVERALAEIWSEVLGGIPVTATDDFFELGGDSLAVGRVLNRCRERFGIRLRARAVFDQPVLRDLAAVVRAHPTPSR